MKYITAATAIAALLLSSACGHNPRQSEAFRQPVRADFSGAWEMDYSLNDDVRARLENYLYRLRKAAERQSTQRGIEVRGGIPGGYSGSAATVADMARFVEQVSRITVIEIAQTYDTVHIEREGTFSLDCHFGDDRPQTHDNRFGREICGWDGHQLVFRLSLPEGMVLQHRLTLSADGQQMNIATTLRLQQAPEPFTLNRAYMRFDGLPRNFNCEQTVSRGKVCSLSAGTGTDR